MYLKKNFKVFYFKHFKVKGNKMVAAMNFGCACGFTLL